MAFCLVVGTHDMIGPLHGYENVRAQCHNCGNWSGRCITELPFFSVCFVPLIPLATHKYHLVACPICNFKQDLSVRPDIQPQGSGGGQNLQGPPPNNGQYGPGPGPQGYPQAQGYPQGQIQGGQQYK